MDRNLENDLTTDNNIKIAIKTSPTSVNITDKNGKNISQMSAPNACGDAKKYHLPNIGNNNKNSNRKNSDSIDRTPSCTSARSRRSEFDNSANHRTSNIHYNKYDMQRVTLMNDATNLVNKDLSMGDTYVDLTIDEHLVVPGNENNKTYFTEDRFSINSNMDGNLDDRDGHKCSTPASTVQNTADELTEGIGARNLVEEQVQQTAAVSTSLQSYMDLSVTSNVALSALFGAAVPAAGHAITLTTNTTTTTTSSTTSAGWSQNVDFDRLNFAHVFDQNLMHGDTALFTPFESNRTNVNAKSQPNENGNKHNNDSMDVTENVHNGYVKPIRIKKTNVVSKDNLSKSCTIYNITKNSTSAKKCKRSGGDQIAVILPESKEIRNEENINQAATRSRALSRSESAQNRSSESTKSMPKKQKNKMAITKNVNLNCSNIRDRIVTQNRFHVLTEEVEKSATKRKIQINGESEEDEIDVSDAEWPHIVHKEKPMPRSSLPRTNIEKLNVVDAKNKSSTKKSDTVKTKEQKKLKISPITVTDATTLISIRSMCDTVATGQYSIRNISIGCKILPKTQESYDLIKRALVNNKVAHFSHPPPTAATFRTICKGLPDFDEDHVANILELDYGYKPLSIRKFGKNANNKIFLIDFSKQIMNKEELKKITEIDNILVKWEKYAPRTKGPTQCRRCFMFGHGERFCMRPKICSFCGSIDHVRDLCPNAIIGENGYSIGEAHCLNCEHFGRKSNHLPTDDQCPSRIAYERMRANNNNKNKKQKPANIETFRLRKNQQPEPVHQQISYAKTVSGEKNRDPEENDAGAGNSNLLSGPELFQIFQSALTRMNACKTKAQQFAIVAELLTQCM